MISGKKINSFFIDIGTKPDLNKFKSFDLSKKKVIFLDRDGVINEDYGYTHKIKDFKFKPKNIKFLNNYKKNYIFFIVTNQSGIGRGYYSFEEFYTFHNYIKFRFYQKKILFSDLEFCPHHNKAKVKKLRTNCKCRKPNNLMFKNLIKRWSVDKKNSFMIGDHKKDELFAKRSRIKFKYYSLI